MVKEILKIKKLTKYYGKTLGVKDLTLALKEGEIFGFIGPNGAGKSTTIRSIMNLINKTSGQVFFQDEELTKDAINLKRQIGYLPSEVNLYEDLTVKKMLDYHASFYPNTSQERCKYLVDLFQLPENKKIEDLSFGNLKKLGIILAFMTEAKLLILDEPTNGLDPIMQQRFYELLKAEKAKKTTIFYSTHILSEIAKICDRVGIIKDGQLIKVETIEELKSKNLLFVTVSSPDIEKISNEFQLTNQIENQTVRFQTKLDSNTIIKRLSKYQIDKILINEPTLEDLFFHYYK